MHCEDEDELVPTKKLLIGNLPDSVTKEEIKQIFGLETTPFLKKICSVEFEYGSDTDNPTRGAFVVVPEKVHLELLKLNGIDIQGRQVTIEEAPHPTVTYDSSTPRFSDVARGNEQRKEIAASKYVEIDTTACRDCYHVPETSEIVYAASNTFPPDATKKLYKLYGREEGMYKIETKQTDFYEGIAYLTHRGENIAKVTIKTEKTYVDENGKVRKERKRENDDDLLITLYQADTEKFQHVSDEEIYHKIIEMGIGKMKKAIIPQNHQKSEYPNGNKFFVLKGVQKNDIERIPHCFEFWNEKTGIQKMWLNFRGKKRKCFFCAKFHDEPFCPLEEQIRKMEKEREDVKLQNDNQLPCKTYADSTFRLACQNALASDVDVMSGAKTGNVFNAIEIDQKNKNVPNVIIVSGQNELQSDMEPQEFLWLLKSKEKRTVELAKNRKVALLAPPQQNLVDTLGQVKEETFRKHLEYLQTLSQNITVWKNPIEEFENDGGRHPSPEQTNTLIQYVNQKTMEDFGVEYTLPSATEEVLVSNQIYKGVTALYKYGCSGCNEKTRNKWYNLCDDCQSNLKDDDETKEYLANFNIRLAELEEINNPALSSRSTDQDTDLKCGECGTLFKSGTDGTEIRDHYKDKHPDKQDYAKDIRRKYKYAKDDGKRSRRTEMFKGAKQDY